MAQDDVVISGVGGHYPECDDLQQFKDALFKGTELITDNAQRWKPGRLGLVSKTGKVSGIDKFDTVFFGMHRKLTDATDPMSRLLLERVFEAVVDAGMNPNTLRGTRTAVFIGSALSESENIFIQTTAENGFGIMGHNRSMMANRVSYYFDFKGPSYALDTSFCSGLGSVELGKRAIESGECDYAVVGTATLSFHPEITQHFHDLGLICPDGVTKPFHKNANGWVRSEAAICMLMQRRAGARRVYASVEHVKVKKYSEDHHAPLMTIDRRHFTLHLKEFYDELYEQTGITADQVDYLEAEGSGYKLRDEVEMAAVDAGICSRRSRPLLVGSTAGQVGNGEASSGFIMLSKALVALETGVIPATRNVTQEDLNPALSGVKEGRLKVVTEHTPLPGPLVAINNFGVTNLFAHILLRANPSEKAPRGDKKTVLLTVGDTTLELQPIPKIVFVSNRNEDGMNVALERLHAFEEDDPEYSRLVQDVYASHIPGHLQRAYTFLPKTEELPVERAPHGGARRPIWFVYSGMGSQWPGMARHLLRVPVFRDAVQRCHDVLVPHGVDLLHIITTEDPTIFDNILHAFVGIAAVQVGLTDVLKSLGIQPDGIIGHSVGELGCSYADGCFTAEEMVLAAHARGRASIETETIKGMMAAVGLGYSEIKSMLPEPIEVACRNSKSSCTISGPAEDVQRFVAQLKDKGVFAKAVNVSNIAYHSRYIAAAGPKLLALLKDVLPSPKPRSERWVSTSVLEERWGEPLAQTSSPEYHTNNLLSAVYFEEGSKKIPNDAICIEIAPHGLLQAIIRRSLDSAVTNVPLTKKDAADGALFLLEAIGKLYLAGLNPQIQNLYDPVEFPVARGTAPISPLVGWDHRETWYTGRYCQQTQFIPAEKHISVRSMDPMYAPYRESVWKGRSIISPGVCLEKVMAMIYRIHDEEAMPIVFEKVQFHSVEDMPVVEPTLLYVMYQRGSGRFEVSKDLTLVATGRAYVPEDGAKSMPKLWSVQPPDVDEDRVMVSQDDVYDELERRGLRVEGKLRNIKQMAASQSYVQGRLTNPDSHMLLLDSLLFLHTFVDSESRSELRVPHRIQRIVVDSDRSWLCEDVPPPEAPAAPGQAEAAKVFGPRLEELVFRMHRASGTLRCANIEVRGVTSRPYKDTIKEKLAVELEQFVPHAELPSALQRLDELVSAAVQLGAQQMALQPLCRQSTEILVGILDDGVHAIVADAFNTISKRFGNVLARRVSPQEASDCDLLVASDAAQAYPLLASHAVLLAMSALRGENNAHVLLQQTFACGQFVLYKKVAGMTVSPEGITYLVWRSLPEQGVPKLLKEYVRVLSGAFRVRCVFLLDPTAPKFSPTHPFYAAQMRLGLAVNVLHQGSWGNFYLKPKEPHLPEQQHQPLQMQAPEQPARDLQVHRLVNIPDLNVEFLGLNSNLIEPTNLEVRDGYILDIGLSPKEREPRRPGLLDYAGISGGRAVMGIMDAETLAVDPILRWNVPEGWSMEDAATVPYAFAMAYVSLVHTAQLTSGERVLIQDGWSALGQAGIAVALDYGCPVFTTYRTEEEKGLIMQRYPQLPEANVLSLHGEEFERVVARVLPGPQYNRGFRVILCTLNGEARNASLRCLGIGGRMVHINSSDDIQGGHIGMYVFIRSSSVYGLQATTLVHCPEAVRVRVRDLVQKAINTGVAHPLDRTVLPSSHAKQAISYLEGDCTDKVVLQLKPTKAPASASAPSEGQRFHCDEKGSYLVVGGCRSKALHTVDWLLSRGARYVLLAGLQDAGLSQVTLRRLALMRTRWGAHVTTVPGVRPDTAQGAATLVSRAANVAPITAVLVLPSSSWHQDEAIQSLDGVLRGLRESVLLVALELAAPSGRVTEACEARRRAGGRAALVAVNVSEPHLRVLALDNALVDPQPVTLVNALAQDQHQATFKERLQELLPLSQDSLLTLGQSILESPRASLLTTCFGGSRAKSDEVPPLFLVSGLSNSPTEEMRSLALKVLANAVLLSPSPRKSDIPTVAADLVSEVLSRQPQGPYTLAARGWAGVVVLEMARLLERRGERVALMLLDCAPRDLQDAVWALGQGVDLQTWLLCSLLHLPNASYDALEALPSWAARLQHALELAQVDEDDRAALYAGLDVVYARLCALAEYATDFVLNDTVITLIRPQGSEADDYRGLDKMSRLPVLVSVSDSDLGTPQFWTVAARAVSCGLYVGSKPMHLQLRGMTQSDTLWQRLR